MTYVLFIDDERNPDDVTWVQFPRDETTFVVRSYDAFVEHVTKCGMPDFVCFDHDLADEHYVAMLKENSDNPVNLLNTIVDYGVEKTGYDCAKWLVDHCADNNYKFPDFVVHSMNPIGRDRIIKYVANAKKHLDI